MVVLVGAVAEPLLAGLARSSNVSLVRPPEEQDSLTAAALALGLASRRASPYVVVPADPLARVAAEWAAMWDLTAGPGPGGSQNPAGDGTGMYLGPLRATRPRRVEAVVTTDDDEGTDRVLQALRALRHGPWWPPLDQQIDSARHFFAGSLAEDASATSRAANAGLRMAALPAQPREYG